MPVLKLLVLLTSVALLSMRSNASSPQTAPKSVAPTPRLTPAQAVQIAQDFCSAIGQPVSVPGTAQFPVPSVLWAHHHWQTAWQVDFPGQAQLTLIDATGTIVDYSNLGLSERLRGQEAGDPIPREAAIQKAATVLQVMHITDELTFSWAGVNQETDNLPREAYGHEWGVDWQRRCQGIDYRWGRVIIHLQAETGEVSALSAVFPAPPPQSTAITISRAQADTIANNVITNAGIQNATLDETKIEIVQPNTYWQPGGNEEEIPGVSRVAYTYGFTTADGIASYDLYIDAQNGTVIGGGHGVYIDLATPKPKVLLRKHLRNTEEVLIYSRHAKTGPHDKPIAVLNKRSQAKMFAALKTARPAKNAGPLALADYRFVLLAKGKPVCELIYIPKTGRLGTGETWAIVPPRFQAWMQTLKPLPAGTKVALD